MQIHVRRCITDMFTGITGDTMPLEERTLVCDILDDGITSVMRTMYAGITLWRYIHCGVVTPGDGYYVCSNISHLGSTSLSGVFCVKAFV